MLNSPKAQETRVNRNGTENFGTSAAGIRKFAWSQLVGNLVWRLPTDEAMNPATSTQNPSRAWLFWVWFSLWNAKMPLFSYLGLLLQTSIRTKQHNIYIYNISNMQIWTRGNVNISGWWFGTCFIFPHIGNHHPIWPIFLRGVGSITNQYCYKFLWWYGTVVRCGWNAVLWVSETLRRLHPGGPGLGDLKPTKTIRIACW